MANGSPNCSVASATLSSTSALSPAAMLGHVMPLSPHFIIGLGPFTNQGCRIIFDKETVTVFHPDGHAILEGWHELDGPQLWQFPLTVLLHLAAASLPPPPTLPPPPLDPGSGVASALKSNILDITKLTDQDSCACHSNVQPPPC
jgi:hypothetical protein